MFETLYSQLETGAALVVVGFAFLRGDAPARVGAGAFGLALLASLLFQDDRPQWGLTAINAVIVAVYSALSWKSRRSWPVWAAALQTLIVMIQLLMVIEQRVPLSAFQAAVDLANFGTLAALAIGVLQAWGDRRAAQPA